MNDRIKEIRKMLNLSQDAFGNRLGVTGTSISRLEKGERNITERMIKSICREFQVDYIWLTTGEGQVFKEYDGSCLLNGFYQAQPVQIVSLSTQGERVHEIRKLLNLTMDAFGEHIGIKKSAISLIENNVNKLTESNIRAICREYNVEYIWLTTGYGSIFKQYHDSFSLNAAGHIIKSTTQGERVKEIRTALGLTLDKFGEIIGLKKSAISKIENGDNTLTEHNIKSICREFKADYVWLTTGERDMFVVPDDNIMTLAEKISSEKNEFVASLFKIFAELDSKDFEVLEKIMDMYVKQKKENE